MRRQKYLIAADGSMYRVDPYYRDERGRFVPRPDVPPAPLSLLSRAVPHLTTERYDHWLVRCIVRQDGTYVVTLAHRSARVVRRPHSGPTPLSVVPDARLTGLGFPRRSAAQAS